MHSSSGPDTHETTIESSGRHTAYVPFGYIPREKEIEDGRIMVAIWSTAPIFLLGLIIAGTVTASSGLVVMISLLTALGFYFAVKGNNP